MYATRQVPRGAIHHPVQFSSKLLSVTLLRVGKAIKACECKILVSHVFDNFSSNHKWWFYNAMHSRIFDLFPQNLMYIENQKIIQMIPQNAK